MSAESFNHLGRTFWVTMLFESRTAIEICRTGQRDPHRSLAVGLLCLWQGKIGVQKLLSASDYLPQDKRFSFATDTMSCSPNASIF